MRPFNVSLYQHQKDDQGDNCLVLVLRLLVCSLQQDWLRQEAQLMLTTGATRLAVSRGQQTWYHFGSIATFR